MKTEDVDMFMLRSMTGFESCIVARHPWLNDHRLPILRVIDPSRLKDDIDTLVALVGPPRSHDYYQNIY
jgi:hypothetical protein